MIHVFSYKDKHYIYDSGSGSLHECDKDTCDFVKAKYETKGKLPDFSEEKIAEIESDIAALQRDGLFLCDEIKAYPIKSNEIKALCLHICHDCNLRCRYCFADEGAYHSEREFMSEETAKKAIDFLILNSGKRKVLEVDFFGGEPLMNFDVVKRLVEYARDIEEKCGKHFRFTLTTNGMLIDDDVIDFCNREMDNVVLSLDGRKEVHDRFRKTAGGNGSFDVIVPKFKKLVDARKNGSYYMRGTFTHFNPDFTEDIATMLDLGFDELSMEPVVCPPTDKYALTDEDKEIIYGQYEKLADMMIERRKAGKPFTFYHYMLDLDGGPCIYKRISGCGSGTEYLAVTPTGELYPCHQFVGNKDYLMGDIWQGVTRTDIRDKFKKCNAYSRKECEECWARLYCSGGCAANAYNSTGDINGTYAYG